MTPPGGTMKANRKYTQKDKLEIMGITINSKKCCNIKIEFTIDARLILLAITGLSEADFKNPSREKIEEQIRYDLHSKGENWYFSPIELGEDGGHYNLKENLEKALPIGKKLFPEFFDTPNSIDFIKKP